MKRLLFAIFLISFGSAVADWHVDRDTPVHSGPGDQYEQIGTLAKFDTFHEVEMLKGPWLKLSFDTGWVAPSADEGVLVFFRSSDSKKRLGTVEVEQIGAVHSREP